MKVPPIEPLVPQEETLPARVLVVEDDELQAKMISTAIEGLGEGWKVVRVPTGEECLHLLETTTFTAAVIDLVLPGCSGLDVVRQFQGRGWPIASILVTAHGSEQTAIEALRLGVSDYLKKGETFLVQLPGVLSRVVRRHREHLRQVSEQSRMRVQLAQRDHRSLLDSFAAPIVHDIKNPLTYIRGMAELVFNHPQAVAPQDAASVILKGAKRIGELVDRLLKFARQESEERSSLDLGEFLKRLVNIEAEHLKSQNVRLIGHLPPEPVAVCAARGALEQVFLNLIANAAEILVLISGGGQIVVELREEGGYAVVTVTDTGPGIPEEAMGHLFQPFNTFRKGKKGTGLGLSIAAGIVKEHGGRIRGENAEKGGARFTVMLPLEQQGPLALLLEDEPHVQDLIQTQLSSLGVRAEVYGDGADVLKVLPVGKWDLVILDLRIPGVSGITIFQEILKTRPDLAARTMVVSGSIEDRELQDLMIRHPVPCLPKPYTTAEFEDIVRMLLRGASRG